MQSEVRYRYDADFGDLLEVKTFNGLNTEVRSVTYEYDPLTGSLVWVNTPEGRVEYGRDPQGRLTQVKTSTGIDTVYTYTSRGQIKSISDRGLSSASDATGTVSYGYDDFGRKESITRPNGTKSEYTYDPLTGWTEAITHKRGGNVLLALGYDRDKTGLITDIAETRPAGEQSGAWHYGYDTLKRLSGATWTPSAGAATAYGYAYDRNGNRLSESVTGSATKFSRYNKLDQLLDERTSTAYPGGTIEKSYAWDKHGRLASETASIASASRVYTWSVDDRLESVQLGTNPTDPTVRYTYDHEGRLIKREKGQDVARFLVDNNNPTGYSQALSEVNADATKPTENYYYGDDFGPLAQVHNPGAAGFDQRFLYGDHLSTTRLLTRSLSSDQYSSYSPYGAVTQPAGGSSLTSYAFTGQSRDLDTGLQYHRARWLNTSQGRWLSEDPVFDWPENFGSVYGYCGASPLFAIDASGRSLTEVFAVVAIFSAVVFTLAQGYLLLISQGGEAARFADETVSASAQLQLRVIKEVGSEAIGFVPILGTIWNAYQAYELFKASFELIKEIASGLSGWKKALFFGLLIVLLALLLLPTARSIISRSDREIGKVEAIALGSNHFPVSDAIHEFAKRIKPRHGYQDFMFHGNTWSVEVPHHSLPSDAAVTLRPEGLSKFLKAQPEFITGKPVRLVSCQTGAANATLARNLAKKLKTTVMAPKQVLWIHPDGRLMKSTVNPTTTVLDEAGPLVEMTDLDWAWFYP